MRLSERPTSSVSHQQLMERITLSAVSWRARPSNRTRSHHLVSLILERLRPRPTPGIKPDPPIGRWRATGHLPAPRLWRLTFSISLMAQPPRLPTFRRKRSGNYLLATTPT